MPELLVDFITSLDGYASAEGWPGSTGSAAARESDESDRRLLPSKRAEMRQDGAAGVAARPLGRTVCAKDASAEGRDRDGRTAAAPGAIGSVG